jgi:Tat protein secretion system quality control protein TatD with DNase activity
VVHVADALAAIWSRPPNEVRHALFNNARRFFAIDPVPDL